MSLDLRLLEALSYVDVLTLLSADLLNTYADTNQVQEKRTLFHSPQHLSQDLSKNDLDIKISF